MFNWFKKIPVSTKVLDTSSLIDGRILDLVETGFLEGELIVADFVLSELQKIADSQDSLRRKKGKRGLEILEKLNNIGIIKIYNKKHKEIESIKEVDAKLVRLCKIINAKLITLDFNLNKVAKVQNIIVLNVNELNNALRLHISRGEAIYVVIVRKGSQKEQGIGYLDDGTMVVVEHAEEMIGERIRVYVRGIKQDASARIIFAKLYTEGDIQ